MFQCYSLYVSTAAASFFPFLLLMKKQRREREKERARGKYDFTDSHSHIIRFPPSTQFATDRIQSFSNVENSAGHKPFIKITCHTEKREMLLLMLRAFHWRADDRFVITKRKWWKLCKMRKSTSSIQELRSPIFSFFFAKNNRQTFLSQPTAYSSNFTFSVQGKFLLCQNRSSNSTATEYYFSFVHYHTALLMLPIFVRS